MRHACVLALVALAVYFLAIRKSDLETLMEPAQNYAQGQVGAALVDMDTLHFPAKASDLARNGVVTVVYFWDRRCPGCQQLDLNLADLLRVRADIAVRKVDLGTDEKAFWKIGARFGLNIRATPFVLIYGKNGKLVAADEGTDSQGLDLLYKWIEKELTKAARPRVAGP